MDYIREEFMRQQQALVVLMQGGIPLAENIEMQADWQPESNEGFMERVGEYRAYQEGIHRNPVRMRGASYAVYPQEQTAEQHDFRQQMKKEPETNVYGNVRGEQSARWHSVVGDAEEIMWEQSSSAMPYDRADYGVRLGKHHVNAVSRAIQRDARRYDGGFSIY